MHEITLKPPNFCKQRKILVWYSHGNYLVRGLVLKRLLAIHNSKISEWDREGKFRVKQVWNLLLNRIGYTSSPATLPKKDALAGVLLCISRNFSEQLFQRTFVNCLGFVFVSVNLGFLFLWCMYPHLGYSSMFMFENENIYSTLFVS